MVSKSISTISVKLQSRQALNPATMGWYNENVRDLSGGDCNTPYPQEGGKKEFGA